MEKSLHALARETSPASENIAVLSVMNAATELPQAMGEEGKELGGEEHIKFVH